MNATLGAERRLLLRLRSTTHAGAAIVAKQEQNEKRTWPDRRSASEDTAIEHVREAP